MKGGKMTALAEAVQMTLESSRGPAVEWVDVTPACAAAWLDNNTHNRNLRENVVYAMARDMASGAWAVNGETVKFDIHGVLQDGQHRLSAVVRSGVTVRMLVVRGLPPKVQETMDLGIRRTFADVLKLRGEKRVPELAALCRRVYLLHAYNLRAAVMSNPGGKYGNPTSKELSEILEAFPTLRNYSEMSARVGRAVSIPGSLAGLLMWVFDEIDADDSRYFFHKLETGEMLAAGQPLHTVRLALLRNEFTSATEDQIRAGAYIIKAWNRYRSGLDMQNVNYRTGGANPEPFPEPK